MASIEITAKKEVEGVAKSATILYDFGDNLDDMAKKFGSDVVFTNARSNFKITAQGAMRRYLAEGKSPEEISELMSRWVPGVALERTVDPVAMLLGKWGSMSDSEKAEVLKKLKTK